MGYTTPFTAVAGTAWTAANWNTYGRDNIAWLATDSPACRAYNSSTLTISNNSVTALTLNSERFDNAGIHSTSSNTSRMTVPTGAGGKYLIGGIVGWGLSAGGTQRQSRVELNNATNIAMDTRPPSASHGSESCPTTSYALSVADFVELNGKQDSGGNLACNNGTTSGPEFWFYWLRT